MGRWIAPDGVALEYEVSGSGPPVLLLHGFASNALVNWVRPGVLDALEDAGHTVVVYDARGHGCSDAPHDPAAYQGSVMVDDALGLIAHLGLGDLAVVGYSMGAQVAAGLTVRQPLVGRSVLGGIGSRLLRPQPGEPPYPALSIAEALEADDVSAIGDTTARSYRVFADATNTDRLALAALQRARAVGAGVDLASLAVPVLVLVGDRDTLVGDPRALVGALPHARLEVVPGDHLSAVTSPEFAGAIVGFLAEA